MPPKQSKMTDAGKDDLQEKILRELYAIYNDPSSLNAALGTKGLEGLGKLAQPSSAPKQAAILTPRRRVTVMIVGNHSAGKSSFINHYTQTKCMKTSVAVETQGFTLVRTGQKAGTFTGDAALEDNSHLQSMVSRLAPADRRAFVEGLSLLTVPSRARDFPNVDLIDTPGLVDGNLSYGYDVNSAILQLAEVCDLILVFLDPIGQALVSRTMAVVAALNDKYPERLRYYLTKVDTIPQLQDRMKVMAQISSQLSGRLKITHGLEIPCISVPVASTSTSASSSSKQEEKQAQVPEDEANALPQLFELISSTVALRVQRNLDTASKDCDKLLTSIEQVLAEQEGKGQTRDKLFWRKMALWPLFLSIAITTFFDLALAGRAWHPARVTTSSMWTELEGKVEPAVLAYREGLALLGVHSLPRRVGAAVAVYLTLAFMSTILQWRVQRLGLLDAPALHDLRGHSGRVEAMAKRVAELRQELVRASEIPDYHYEGASSSKSSRDSHK